MGPVIADDAPAAEEEIPFAERPAGPESQGVMPVLTVGTKVQVISGPNAGIAGRMAYITGIEFATPEDEARFNNPNGKKRNTAKVSEYTVKTRDARTDTFNVTPDQIRVMDETEGWGRGSTS